MKKIITLIIPFLLFSCQEIEEYPMVLEYSIHFNDGACTTHEYYFMGNEHARAVIDFASLGRKQYIRLSRRGGSFDPFTICQSSGQIEIISIKRNEHERQGENHP